MFVSLYFVGRLFFYFVCMCMSFFLRLFFLLNTVVFFSVFCAWLLWAIGGCNHGYCPHHLCPFCWTRSGFLHIFFLSIFQFLCTFIRFISLHFIGFRSGNLAKIVTEKLVHFHWNAFLNYEYGFYYFTRIKSKISVPSSFPCEFKIQFCWFSFENSNFILSSVCEKNKNKSKKKKSLHHLGFYQ